MEIDNKEKVDYLFKFIIIGDTGVGKSCILSQYLRGKCKWLHLRGLIAWVCLVNPSTKHTVGVEFGMKYEKVN
jgi:hypothetical protein